MACHVFISYRRAGGLTTARMLYERLKRDGYEPFLDAEHLHHGKFDQQIYDRIRECTDFILIMSPGSLDRCVNEDDWVRLELREALRLKKRIIPVILKGFNMPDKLPEELVGIDKFQGVVVEEGPYYEAYIAKLKAELKYKPRRRLLWIVPLVIAVIAACAIIPRIFTGGEEGQLPAEPTTVITDVPTVEPTAVPTAAFTPTPDTATPALTPTPKPTATPTPAPTEVPEVNIHAGDRFFFGSYEQDKNKNNGQEPIEWLILSVDKSSSTVMAIARYCLDAEPYHWSTQETTWAQSHMRDWLNSNFYSIAFTSAERKSLVQTTVDGSKDYVYLLDATEANTYLYNKKCYATGYAQQRGIFITDREKLVSYWLRASKTTTNGTYVAAYGDIKYDNRVNVKDNGVRPVITLSFSYFVGK